MTTSSNRAEFAPRSVDNAATIEVIQQARIDRKVNMEIADAARKLNKVLDKTLCL